MPDGSPVDYTFGTMFLVNVDLLIQVAAHFAYHVTQYLISLIGTFDFNKSGPNAFPKSVQLESGLQALIKLKNWFSEARKGQW